MATQGSMARCRVPDVLQLYEKCMKNMYKWNRCDDVTLSKQITFYNICFMINIVVKQKKKTEKSE